MVSFQKSMLRNINLLKYQSSRKCLNLQYKVALEEDRDGCGIKYFVFLETMHFGVCRNVLTDAKVLAELQQSPTTSWQLLQEQWAAHPGCSTAAASQGKGFPTSRDCCSPQEGWWGQAAACKPGWKEALLSPQMPKHFRNSLLLKKAVAHGPQVWLTWA